MAIASLVLLPSLQAFGWGQKGHDVTAAVAARHISPRTAAAVDSLLEGQSMVYWANWLDNASHTPEYDYSRTWHYRNIDSEYTYDNAPLLPSGDVVRALFDQTAALRSGTLDKKQSALALKMIIHLMGDLHQPLHLGRASDRGGNKRKVNFFNRESNLHSIWDTSLPEAAHKWSYTEWADQIDHATPSFTATVTMGDFNDWGRETYSVCTEVYAATAEGSTVSYDYIARWTPVVEQQLLKAGLRLAYVLDSIFDSSATR